MSAHSVSDYLKFNYNALYPTLLFGPSIAISISDVAEIGLLTAVAGIASHVISHKITKISLEKGWEDGSRTCAVFFSTLAIYSLAACAAAILNIPGAFVCLGIGVAVSFSNAIFEGISVQDAQKDVKNREDWSKAHVEFPKYVKLYEEYSKLVKINYATSPASMLQTIYNKPEWGTIFLKQVEDEKASIVKLIENKKLQSQFVEIAKKIYRYERLWEELNQVPSNVNNLIVPDELQKQNIKLDNSNTKTEDLETVNALVDESLKCILARFEELNIQPSSIS